jgi:hypothetical protein
MRSRVPSVRTILDGLRWLDKEGDPDKLAREIRKILRAAVTNPENLAMDGTIRPRYAREALERVNRLTRCHGVEDLVRDRFSVNQCHPRYYYVNTGDTYTATIAYSLVSGTFRVTSWGDIVETEERRGIKYQ